MKLTKTHRYILISILSSFILLNQPVSAEPGMGSPGADHNRMQNSQAQSGLLREGRAFRWARLAYKLQLTAEQRAAIKLIFQEKRELSQPLIEEVVANRMAINSLIKSEPYDAAQVQLLADMQGELSSQLIVIRANSRAAFLAILTDEQKDI